MNGALSLALKAAAVVVRLIMVGGVAGSRQGLSLGSVVDAKQQLQLLITDNKRNVRSHDDVQRLTDTSVSLSQG